jgi:transcriptional regulator with XRE-family HTH domain
MTTRGAVMTEKGQPKKGTGTLGELLQALRQGKNLTGQALARRLGTSQATISKIETGLQKPTMDYVVRFAAEIGLSKAETTRLLRRLNLLPAGATGDRAAELLSLDLVAGDEAERQRRTLADFEASATVIQVFAPQGIPEILQTEEYARSALRLSGLIEPGAVEKVVQARLKRQRGLGRNKQYVVVLTEGALRARICSCPETVNQLDRIKSFAEAPSARLGIIAWSARLIATIPAAFAIYDDTLACVEVPHGHVFLTRDKDVEFYLRLFEALERMAVMGQEAASVLDRIIRDFGRLEDLERSVHAPSV